MRHVIQQSDFRNPKTAVKVAIIKRISVRVFSPSGEESRLYKFKAVKGRYYQPDDIENVIANVYGQLHRSNPGLKFRHVKIAEDAFNFMVVIPEEAAA